jgi:hypothetical protein
MLMMIGSRRLASNQDHMHASSNITPHISTTVSYTGSLRQLAPQRSGTIAWWFLVALAEGKDTTQRPGGSCRRRAARPDARQPSDSRRRGVARPNDRRLPRGPRRRRGEAATFLRPRLDRSRSLREVFAKIHRRGGRVSLQKLP